MKGFLPLDIAPSEKVLLLGVATSERILPLGIVPSERILPHPTGPSKQGLHTTRGHNQHSTGILVHLSNTINSVNVYFMNFNLLGDTSN